MEKKLGGIYRDLNGIETEIVSKAYTLLVSKCETLNIDTWEV